MRLFLLIITCAGLSFAAWYDFTSSSEDELVSERRADVLRRLESKKNVKADKGELYSISIKNPYEELKLANLEQTVKRPLFSQSRRPPAPLQATIVLPKITRAPQKPEPRFLLLGVLKNGENSVALLREEGTGKYFRVVKGDFIRNIRIADVLLKSVKLERQDGSKVTLNLKFTKP